MAQRVGVRGTSVSGGAPPTQSRLKYDRSDRILMKALADAPALHIVIKKQMKRPTGSFKFYMYEDAYETFGFDIEGCSAAGADAAITTSTVYFKSATALRTYLQKNDILHISSYALNQTNTDGTVAAAGENLIVEEFLTDYVMRCTRAGGAGTQTYNVTADSGDTLYAETLSPAFEDASYSPVAISQSLDEDYNYLQTMRKSWMVSNRNNLEDMYGEKDMQLEARRKRLTFFRNMERTLWTGTRYGRYASTGLAQTMTGGILPYIADTSATYTRVAVYTEASDLVTGTGAQRIWKVNKNFDLPNYNRFLEKALKWGSRSNKVQYGGRGFVTEFENLYQSKFGAFDYDVDQFGFAVAMVKNSFGMLPLAVENEFSPNNNGYNYNFAVIDHDYLWYRYYGGQCIVKGCGYGTSDVHTHKEIQQSDQAARKDELYADVGWDQKHRDAHAWGIWDGTN
jgi:hypothetical protein